MRRTTWLILGLLVLTLAAVVPLVTADPGPDAAAAVRVLPAGGTYPVGAEIDVEVWVEDVEDLYGADVQLTFDPTRLRVVGPVTPRDDLLSPDLVVKQEADNDLGTVWYAVTQLNPSEPASGSGALFSFTLQTLAAGDPVPVDVDDAQLANRDGEFIPAAAHGAQYAVGEGYRVFLPLAMKNH